MKNKSSIYPVLLAVLLLSILFCCKKEAIKTAPATTISAVTNIAATSASSGGEITADGGAAITARGVCWSTNQSPTTLDSKTSNGSGTGSFTSSITGLTPGTTYNIKAYATNSVGTGYSSQSTFTTLALAPVLTTADLSSVTSTTANSGGNITNDGGSAVTARGVCWSTSQNPTIADSKISSGTGSGSYTSVITGLTPGATYYVRAYATNSIGTGYGNQVTAAATAILPVLTTTAISALTSTTATSGGNITSDGGSVVTARGVCWSTTANPTIASSKTTDGTGSGSFISSITVLTPGATYYVRAYATNSVGTAYGNQQTFTSISIGGSGTVTDIDGNVYKTVTIGTQVWMVENLKTTKYRNGDNISNETDPLIWQYSPNTSNGAYCNYLNNATYSVTYGRLYNWYAINEDRKISPAGWHIPTDGEWTTLTDFLGGESVAGGKLKETGTSYWPLQNTHASNETGFTGLPGGFRAYEGKFSDINFYGYWWSSTGGFNRAWLRFLAPDNNGYIFRREGYLQDGYSVRCIKD